MWCQLRWARAITGADLYRHREPKNYGGLLAFRRQSKCDEIVGNKRGIAWTKQKPFIVWFMLHH